MAVDGNLGSVRVGLIVHKQVEWLYATGSLRLLALVGQIYLESSSIGHSHTAHALLVQTYLRIVNLQRALIQHSTWVVCQRGALVLPWVGRCTATCAVYKSLRTQDGHSHLLLQLLQYVLLFLLKLVAHEDGCQVRILVDSRTWIIGDNLELFLLFLFIKAQVRQCHTIYVYVQMAQLVRSNGEALLTCIGLLRTIGAFAIRGQHRCQAPLELGTTKSHFCL